jgi:hypothetical protein
LHKSWTRVGTGQELENQEIKFNLRFLNPSRSSDYFLLLHYIYDVAHHLSAALDATTENQLECYRDDSISLLLSVRSATLASLVARCQRKLKSQLNRVHNDLFLVYM